MNHVLSSFFLLLILSACGPEDYDPETTASLVAAYDTVEIEYQKLGDLATELISTVSADPAVPIAGITRALEREPVVSLDFGKPVTTNRDIANFVRQQEKLKQEVTKLFIHLEKTPKWRDAPFLPDIKQRYRLRLDTITIASKRFNEIFKQSNYNIQISQPGAAASR